MKKGILLIFFAMLSSQTLAAAQGWTTSKEILSIDSLPAENSAYISLVDYTNPVCSSNRVKLVSESPAHFDKMFSMVLSAFHSGAKINFYLYNGSNCDSNRVVLSK